MSGSKIAITLGEPAGIGVELVCKLAIKNQLDDCIVIGDENLIQRHIDKHRLSLTVNEDAKDVPRINCKPIYVEQFVELGKLNSSNSNYVLSLLDEAARGCLAGEYSAMVTCPLHKGIINDAGIAFSGHTEYLAELSNTPKVVMMLANEAMKVTLATTHIPLKEVSATITKESLSSTLHVVNQDMQRKFGITNPKIAVCGLNPHAGEDGHLGYEEIDVISPTLKDLKAQGMQVFGPFPADSLFTTEMLKNYDVVLAMYHDQGLTPLKYAGFGRSVNITLGLPFIRTSVDHGTALDIAGKNMASETSLVAALEMARKLAKTAQNTSNAKPHLSS